MRKARAFSLLEAMIAMGLVFVVLGLISVLIREYSDMSRHAAARDNTMDAVQFALRQMRNELGGAVEIVTPGFRVDLPPGSTVDLGSVLSFKKFESERRDGRIPLPPAPLPADYDPWDPRFLSQITYFQSGKGSLLRTAANSAPQTVVPEINTFNATQLSPTYVQLTLSFQEVRRHRHYSLDAKLWVKQLEPIP